MTAALRVALNDSEACIAFTRNVRVSKKTGIVVYTPLSQVVLGNGQVLSRMVYIKAMEALRQLNQTPTERMYLYDLLRICQEEKLGFSRSAGLESLFVTDRDDEHYRKALPLILRRYGLKGSDEQVMKDALTVVSNLNIGAERFNLTKPDKLAVNMRV